MKSDIQPRVSQYLQEHQAGSDQNKFVVQQKEGEDLREDDARDLMVAEHQNPEREVSLKSAFWTGTRVYEGSSLKNLYQNIFK